MNMKLFNARTQRIETFRPAAKDKEVTLYLCVTSAEESLNLDQAFAYCTADVLVRYLEKIKGWQVAYGQNIDGAAQEPSEIEEMRSLNVSFSEHFARATKMNKPSLEADLLIRNDACDQAVMDPSRPNLFARFWLNTAVVKDDEQAGPISSPHSQVLVRDLLERYSPDTVRLYLAQHHYRRAWTHDEVALEKASQCVEKLKAALTAVSTDGQPINSTPAQNRFTAVMDNDLDTLKGIATLLNLADEILFRLHNGYSIENAQAALQNMAVVFGLELNTDPLLETNVPLLTEK